MKTARLRKQVWGYLDAHQAGEFFLKSSENWTQKKPKF